MFYSMGLWACPMSRFAGCFASLPGIAGIAGLDLCDAFLDMERYSADWALLMNDIYPEGDMLGPASWAPERPGGPSYGSELGIPHQFTSNLTYMGHSDF